MLHTFPALQGTNITYPTLGKEHHRLKSVWVGYHFMKLARLYSCQHLGSLLCLLRLHEPSVDLGCQEPVKPSGW